MGDTAAAVGVTGRLRVLAGVLLPLAGRVTLLLLPLLCGRLRPLLPAVAWRLLLLLPPLLPLWRLLPPVLPLLLGRALLLLPAVGVVLLLLTPPSLLLILSLLLTLLRPSTGNTGGW
jgi:hypothetical protein